MIAKSDQGTSLAVRMVAVARLLREAASELEGLVDQCPGGLADLGGREPCTVLCEPASTPPSPVAILPALLSAAQLASLLGCNVRTARRWRKERGFPKPIKVAKGALRWRRADVERWIGEKGR